MESSLRYLWVLLACLFLQVQADCKSYGVDFSNGGSYQIDGTSNDYFTFITVFQGCNQETINPILVSPDNNEYACSSINTQPEGTQVTSTCGIPFSAMKSGAWRIVVEGSQIAVQRTINLNVGNPSVVIVTATPTIVLGITSTPRAQTVRTTSTQTQTLIVVGATVTQNCGGNGGGTRTVTNFPQNSQTVTRTSTILRTITDGQQTSFYTTTVLATASCHDASTQTRYDGNAVIASAQPVVRGASWAREVAPAAEKRAVAAITSTYTETTYTVTKTVVTTIPPRTTTELALTTTTTTVTPPPSTFCAGGNNGGQVTVTVIGGGGPITQTNIVYETTRASGTVWVGQTQYSTYTNSASATACWRNGGWFGV